MIQILGFSVLFYFLAEAFPAARNLILFMVFSSVCWMFLFTPAAGVSLFLLMVGLLLAFLIIRYLHVILFYLFGVFLGLAFLYMVIAGLGQLVSG
jgi:hypothetical protein